MPDEEVRTWMQERGQLAAALAKAQGAFPPIVRNQNADMGTYKYKYAGLDVVLAAVRKPLADNGLAIVQMLDGLDLVTMLLHSGGAVLESRTPLPRPDKGTIQQLGSLTTYMRRYALQAMLGVAAEEDDDGKAGNKLGPVDQLTPRPAPRPVAPQAPRTAPVAAGPSQADIASLHAQFTPTDAARPFTPDELEGIAPTGGLTTAELFKAAEDESISQARLTLTAKTLFGQNRWKITDLTNEERQRVWDETAGVPV